MAATGGETLGRPPRVNISVTSINCEGPNISSSTIGTTLITNNGLTTTTSTSSPILTTTTSLTTTTTTTSLSNLSSSSLIATTSTTLSSTSTTTTTLTNGTHFYENCGVRISVPKMEESDSETELSNIENSLNVGLRDNRNKDIPRPMSWEGELSETEDNNMMIVENLNNDDSQSSMTSQQQFTQKLLNSPVIQHQNNDTTITLNDNKNIIIAKDAIKPELIDTNSSTLSGNIVGSFSLLNNKKYHPDFMNLKNEIGLQQETTTTSITNNVINSPLLARSKTTMLPANPSPDSAIHSIYTHSSPSQSPLTSRHTPYTPSLSRNNSDASHSSCYSYSSEFSPTHSPIQGRHYLYGGGNGGNTTINNTTGHHQILYRPMLDNVSGGGGEQKQGSSSSSTSSTLKFQQTKEEGLLEGESIPSAGISRQQLINSPCPICGDKISGFHYGIFSCESCKGFFKRTVQNRKNYVCLRGAACSVTISTRKKCPACRFEKCLNKGMKLEAIREDRTRGGRSTYQCSYTLPGSMLSPSINSSDSNNMYFNNQQRNHQHNNGLKMESMDNSCSSSTSYSNIKLEIPSLLQEIMDVEHLWHYNEAELSRLNQPPPLNQSSSVATNPLLASAGLSQNEGSPDLIANLCNVADHRLYKIVKWCKSLPLFKNISIDDQICLLINSWCELLLFSCCFRSMISPGEIRISLGKSITLQKAKSSGLQACIERMLNLTEHLRRLKVDRYEYVAMKVIVLLQSDTSELKEPEKVRTSQEKALQALQAYTLSHYPETPAKFGELLLRIPELQRTCQVGKEMLIIKSKEGEEFNLLMELLRGEH